MRHRVLTGLLVLLVLPALVWGQSLSELAKEEKERRKKNRDSGKEVQVITDRELAGNKGSIANPETTVAGQDSPSTPSSTRTSAEVVSVNDEAPPSPPIRDDVDEGEQPATDIPADASLEQKLSLLESMKASYLNDVKAIDEEIQKNNRRLAEIQDALVSTGGTGLPTAPQADRAVRNPGDIPALRSEQQELREKNESLEAQKKTLKDDILLKARRAGIPPGYLNF